MQSTYMSKAFDSLRLNLLPAKVKAYGLSNPALRLMQSCFSNREKTEQEQVILQVHEGHLTGAVHRDHLWDHCCGTYTKIIRSLLV